MTAPAPPASIRLDRWLWTARLFKTRALAVAAIAGGKVDLNGARAKKGALVRPGDRLRVRRPPYEAELLVRGVSERRGPAREAAALYEETAESRAARERLAYQMKHVPVPAYDGKGRPTKRERRAIERLKEDAGG